jgi:hypothetical protein
MRIRGVPSGELPAVYVELGFGPLEALLDSGAVRCLMSGHVYSTLMRTSSLAPSISCTSEMYYCCHHYFRFILLLNVR